MVSILTAIKNLSNKQNNKIEIYLSSRISVNAMGDSLQFYIQNLFLENINNLSVEELNSQKQEIFSWLGNQNNIPDLILKNGDAIEIKKIETAGSLALNSSHPKQFISSDSPLISVGCKNCEGINRYWKKELWYIIGTVNNNRIRYLFFIQGSLYAAHESIYLRIKHNIKTGVERIDNIQFSETNELGRVNRVDPLGITSLRIRGMWSICNPFSVYNYIPEIERNGTNEKLIAYAIIEKNKYNNFLAEDKKIIELKNNIDIFDKQIKNPDNPAQLIESKLIRIVV